MSHHLDPSPACPHAHRDAVDTDAVQSRARSYAMSKGISFTPTRQRVLALLATAGKQMAAYEIAEKLSGSRKVQAVQVYRALEFLQKAACGHRLGSRSAFFASDHRHGEGKTVVFMVCSQCSAVRETTSELAARGSWDAAKTTGHDIRRLRWWASARNMRVYPRFDASGTEWKRPRSIIAMA